MTFFPDSIRVQVSGIVSGWLASLTLEDKERPNLDLSRVVYEYVDVFPDELPGLPP